MKQDAIGSGDEVTTSLATGLEQHHHLPPDDSSQAMHSHFSDLPSDLALNQCSFTTYARLEDVVGGGGGGTVFTKPQYQDRHDSHHPSTDDDYHRTHPDASFEGLQAVHTSSDGQGDYDSGLEIRFKKLGVGHNAGLHENNRARYVSSQRQETHASVPRTSDTQYRPESSLFTSRIENALENFPESDFSEDNGFYADDEDDEHQASASDCSHHDASTTQQTDDYPQQPPPEPQPQPLGAPYEIPAEPLSLAKRHARARTFPLRLNHHVAPPNPAAAPSLARSSVAPRFTGFANLSSSQTQTQTHLPPPVPLHLQAHPGHAPHLPSSHPHPHPNFASNPAPLPLPLPRRPSNPPPAVDPAQDAFYHALKAKLWKLAQELEARGSERVVRGCTLHTAEGEDAVSPLSASHRSISSPPSPSTDALDENIDEEAELAEFFAGDDLFAPRFLERRGAGADDVVVREDGDGQEDSEGELDSEELEEVVSWRAKEAQVEALGQRRASEGRGRKWARERAERGYKNWLRVPD